MKPILFPLEKLLILFLFVQLLIQAERWLFLIISSTLLILSIQFQGARPVTPLFIIIIIAQFFHFTIFRVILITITGCLCLALRFYDINVPLKGSYLAGHKYVKIDFENKKLLSGIYYPTMEKGSKVEWIPQKQYRKTLYEIFHVDPKMKRIPYQLFKFAVSFIQKVWMPVQGSSKYHMDVKNSKKSKVIIVSHGLGAHLNAYTSFCANWASHGYIVVTINHVHDEVSVNYLKSQSQDPKDVRKYLHDCRYRDLLIRVSEVRKVITQILDKNYLQVNLGFQGEIDEIILAGHSYGGATVLATKSIMNKQLTKTHKRVKLFKKIICLDPWMFPFNDEIFKHLNQEDILIINSQYFMQEVPQIYYLQKLLNQLKQGNPNMKAVMIQKMDHITQCDMAYIFGNILQLVGSIKYHRYTDYFIALNILIMNKHLANKSKQEIIDGTNKFIENKKLDKASIRVRQQYRLIRELTVSAKMQKME